MSAYAVYERLPAPAAPAQRWTGAATQATLTAVAPGVHTYYVTAKNTWGESAPSAAVQTPPGASVPGGVRVQVTVTLTVAP